MIERIEIAREASYGNTAEVMDGLAPINFLYGPNGSGKTTISRVIADPSLYPFCTVHWEHGTELQTIVYNPDFVKKNFSESANLKGIYTLGTKNKEIQNMIAQTTIECDGLTHQIESWEAALKGKDGNDGKRGDLAAIEADFKNKCWEVEKHHDEKLQDALTGYRHDKQKFKEKILAERLTPGNQILTQAELEAKAASVFGPSPAAVTIIPSLDASDFLAWESAAVLMKPVIGKSDVDIAAMIRKLGNSDWVKQGIAYFELNNGICPFCQQMVPESLTKSLTEYFDEAFAKDTDEIAAVQTGYKQEGESIQQALQNVIESAPHFMDVDKLKQEKDVFDSRFQMNLQRLNAKAKEPSQIVTLEPLGSVVQAAAQLIDDANQQAQKHNTMIANIPAERAKLTNQVWAFLSKGELASEFAAYDKKKTGIQKAITSFEDKIKKANADRGTKEEKIKELEKSTTSIQPTVDEINRTLKCFGFSNFYLEAASESTYRIRRADGSDAKETLSEGERGFITFLYFFHLLNGSTTESGMTANRVIVFDDPVSSFDSDVLFIVSTLVRQVIEQVRNGSGYVKQVFVLTHNVFFHKEVTFRQDGKLTFWTVRKPQGDSKLKQHKLNPITTAYALLWDDVRNPVRAGVSLQNTLRRILEHYFRILGGRNWDEIISLFDGEEKVICNALFSWVNDGSHSVPDDVYISRDEDSNRKFLEVFREVFKKTQQTNHYNMMMREPVIIESTAEVALTDVNFR
jgi:wobble nucleotide-excising tRNase